MQRWAESCSIGSKIHTKLIPRHYHLKKFNNLKFWKNIRRNSRILTVQWKDMRQQQPRREQAQKIIDFRKATKSITLKRTFIWLTKFRKSTKFKCCIEMPFSSKNKNYAKNTRIKETILKWIWRNSSWTDGVNSRIEGQEFSSIGSGRARKNRLLKLWLRMLIWELCWKS